MQFNLSPTYALYMAARYRASTHFRPDTTPNDRAHRLTALMNKVATVMHQVIQVSLNILLCNHFSINCYSSFDNLTFIIGYNIFASIFLLSFALNYKLLIFFLAFVFVLTTLVVTSHIQHHIFEYHYFLLIIFPIFILKNSAVKKGENYY